MGFLPLFATASVYAANDHRVNPEFYQVTHLRTDGVHRRESADTGQGVLKIARITGAAFSGYSVDQSMRASLLPHVQDFDSFRLTKISTRYVLTVQSCVAAVHQAIYSTDTVAFV